MRYVLVLLGIFSLNDVASANLARAGFKLPRPLVRSIPIASAMPTRAGLLEIRSMPVARDKLMRRLLWDEAKNGKATNEGRKGKGSNKVIYYSIYGFGIFAGLLTFISPLVPLDLAARGAMGIETALAISASATFLIFGTVGIGGNAYFKFEKERANKLIGEHVYYTQIRDGRAVLMRGIAKKYYKDTGTMIVNTADGEEDIKIKDITASIPDHPNLHRRVSLLTNAEDEDLLYLGQVSIVYDDGSYEIEIERKVDINNVKHPVDEPFTIFVHASLKQHEGGFTFIDSQASEHENVYEHPYTNNSLYDELIASGQQTDTASDSRELEQTVVPEHN